MASGPAELSNGSPLTGTRAMTEAELQRKRARDRKAQQAMRDRNKWTLQNQGQQIVYLTSALEAETSRTNNLSQQVRSLESENDSLRTQIAALRLKLLATANNGNDGASSFAGVRPPWKILPKNTDPTNISDTILQRFVGEQRVLSMASTAGGPSC